MNIRKSIAIAGLFISSFGVAQNAVPIKWHLLDAQKDSLHGISLNKAYEFLKGKKSQTVIVAVLDSGVDTTHEDLKNVLWRNPKEIPDNGIDDDNNGYVDDVYGWNFLGNKNGTNANKASAEVTRIYHRFKDRFLDRPVDTLTMSITEKNDFRLWKNLDSILLQLDQSIRIYLFNFNRQDIHCFPKPDYIIEILKISLSDKSTYLTGRIIFTFVEEMKFEIQFRSLLG